MAINYTPATGITNKFKKPEVENRVEAFVAQNDAYIEQLKERQQVQKMQDAYYYRSLELRQNYDDATNRRNDSLRKTQANQKFEVEQRRLAVEARVARQKAEMMAAKPSNFEKITDFVLKVAPQVGEIIESAETAYREEQEALGQLDAYNNPQRTAGPGSITQSNATLNIAANNDKVVGVSDLSGGDPSTTNDLRIDSNTIRGRAHLAKLAEWNGATLGREFMSAMADQSQPSPFKVSINGQLYPINQLPDNKPGTVDLAFTQYAVQVAKSKGYVDALGPGVISFYEGAKAGFKPLLAELYKKEYQATIQTDLDQTEQYFQIAIKEPGREADAAVDLFQGYLRTSDYNFKTANEKLIDALSDPTLVSDAAFSELEQSLQLPGRPKPFAQDRPADWQQIQINRQQANSQRFSQNMTTRKQGAQQQAEQLAAQFGKDYGR